ncbi:uncharacterized protein LOC124351115 [Daphnia pulicaria]|uniref:uncharacterized protein LOC124341419 n=1 Tax=Daphnia pulicaria TaxID=35523 RepID=UPI001EECD330|nr:uncharacterized protein LOC124341419 [Daphnia pulicaria]XP_046657836.1 uncharacterized protein LOC124351115 [Daphnia pulicaria]
MWLLLVVTQLMASGLVLNNHQLKIGMILITNNNPNILASKIWFLLLIVKLNPSFSLMVLRLVNLNGKLACYLMLRQRYFLTYEALLFVSQSIHEHYSRNMAIVQEKLAALFISTEGTGSIEFKAAFL